MNPTRKPRQRVLFSGGASRSCSFRREFSPYTQTRKAHVHFAVDDRVADEGEGEESTQFNLSQLADTLDTAFIQACLQLSTGYVDVLKLYIAGLFTAYKAGQSPTQLVAALDAIDNPACGRPLAPEEVQLRNAWIQGVYCVLDDVRPNLDCSSQLETSLYETYRAVVPRLKELRLVSSDFKSKEVLEATRSCFRDISSDIDNAITLQTLRAMWFTWIVVDEIERCEGEFSKMDTPRPNIPGAFQ